MRLVAAGFGDDGAARLVWNSGAGHDEAEPLVHPVRGEPGGQVDVPARRELGIGQVHNDLVRPAARPPAGRTRAGECPDRFVPGGRDGFSDRVRALGQPCFMLRPGRPAYARSVHRGWRPARTRGLLGSAPPTGGAPDPLSVIEDELRGGDEGLLLVMEIGGEVAGGIQYSEEDDPMYRHAGIDIYLGTASRARARA